MLDLDKNRIEIISKDGREYMQLYDADGKEVHGITSMDYYEHLTEYIYVSLMSQMYGYFVSDGKSYPD